MAQDEPKLEWILVNQQDAAACPVCEELSRHSAKGCWRKGCNHFVAPGEVEGQRAVVFKNEGPK